MKTVLTADERSKLLSVLANPAGVMQRFGDVRAVFVAGMLCQCIFRDSKLDAEDAIAWDIDRTYEVLAHAVKDDEALAAKVSKCVGHNLN